MSECYCVPLIYEQTGKASFVLSAGLITGEKNILFDCGNPHSIDIINTALSKHQLSLKEIDMIFITHHDMDHIGGLAEILEEYPHIEVYCSQEEVQYLTGNSRPYKLGLLMNRKHELNESELIDLEKRIQRANDYRTVSLEKIHVLNKDYPFNGGISVIESPGHVPGHVSFYHHPTKTLISGDALTSENGVLRGANPVHTADMKANMQSIQKFLGWDIERVITYHGGEVFGDIHRQINDLIKAD